MTPSLAEIRKIANDIGMEWKRVPMMPTARMFDDAWHNIVDRHRALHGRENVSAALELIKNGMFNGTVPHEETP